MDREKVIAAVKKRAKEGHIACAACFRIAEEHKIPKKELGALINELGIKVRQCQLGLFK